MAFRRIQLTLHIGLQKTGTTLIQRSLRKLAPLLREEGTVYIDRQHMLAMENVRGWSAFKRSKPDLRDAFMSEMQDLVIARSKTRLGRLRHVLISNEGLVGTNSPNYSRPFRPNADVAISDMIEALQPRSTRLVLYVRRQDKLIESAYMQRIHAGKTYTFEKFLGRFEEGPIMDYSSLVARLETLPTVTKITTRPFEFIGAGPVPFVTDFLQAAEVPSIDLQRLEKMRRSNPSYTAPAYQAALTINRLVEGKDQKSDVRRFLKHLFPIEEYPSPSLFTDEQRQACLDLYRPSNEAFFRRHQPDVPPDVYSSEQATKQLGTYLS